MKRAIMARPKVLAAPTPRPAQHDPTLPVAPVAPTQGWFHREWAQELFRLRERLQTHEVVPSDDGRMVWTPAERGEERQALERRLAELNAKIDDAIQGKGCADTGAGPSEQPAHLPPPTPVSVASFRTASGAQEPEVTPPPGLPAPAIAVAAPAQSATVHEIDTEQVDDIEEVNREAESASRSTTSTSPPRPATRHHHRRLRLQVHHRLHHQRRGRRRRRRRARRSRRKRRTPPPTR